MRKTLFPAILAVGTIFAGAASAAPLPAAGLFGIERDQNSGQIEFVRHGGRGLHRGWGKRHHGWQRGHHYGWRHGRHRGRRW